MNSVRLRIWGLIAAFTLLASVPFLVPHTAILAVVAFVPLFALADLLEEHNVDTLLFSGQVSKSLVLMEDSLRKYLKDIKITMAPGGAVFQGIASLFENN